MYTKLGLDKLKTNNKLDNSIKKIFKLNNINEFNANYIHFTFEQLDKVTFNNNYKLFNIDKRIKKINFNGYIYSGSISVLNKYAQVDIFVKKIPVFNPLKLELQINLKNTINEYFINDFKNSLNSSYNIEIFVTYLTSK